VFTSYYDDVMATVKRIFDNYVKHKQMPAAAKTPKENESLSSSSLSSDEEQNQHTPSRPRSSGTGS